MENKKSNKKNKIETVANLMKPKKKYFYKCYCTICKGKKVDSRTQETHTKNKSLWKSKTSRENQQSAIESRKKRRSITSNVSKKRKMDSHQDELNRSTSPNPDSDPSPDLPNNEDNLNALFTSRSKSSSHFHAPVPDDDDNFEEDDEEDEDNINQEEGFFAPPEMDSDEIPVIESLNDSIDSEIII